MKKDDFSGMKVLVMGLGLSGGGLESARYLASKGAELTVTDLRDETLLAASIQELKDFPVRYVLGRHEMEDFRNADLVVKNPGVRPDSPYLKAARKIETDISLFLDLCLNLNEQPRISAVTGTKGKSSTSSALHWVLEHFHKLGDCPGNCPGKAYIGGNIKISPLSFLDQLEKGDDVVLELSSWQLGDLRGKNTLKPRAAVLTPILRDHLDRYGSMDAYIADKRLIYENQSEKDVTVAEDDDWGSSFHRESRGRPLVYSKYPLKDGVFGGWVSEPQGSAPCLARLWNKEPGRIVEIVPDRLLVPGLHQKQNLLAAALALLDLGLDADFIRESLGSFPGIEHRLEFFHENGGIRFYNDSAATIPEAAAAAVMAFEKPPLLVTGGTDKDLDFSPLARSAAYAKALFLLAGTGTEKLRKLLDADGIKYRGPFDSVEQAVSALMEIVVTGDTVVLSPGCTSFGMFLNEFDRGQKWKEAVRRLAG